jgi:hypothetical protein
MDWQGLEAEVFDNKSSRAVEQDEAAQKQATINKQRAVEAKAAQKRMEIYKQ